MNERTIPLPKGETALNKSVAALRRIADYSLPNALDRRMLDLGERKEYLSNEEHEELLAWVKFAQDRTIEKLEAEAALRKLAMDFPDLDAR